MKTATVADLRNHFRRVASWIEHGETVQLGEPKTPATGVLNESVAAVARVL